MPRAGEPLNATFGPTSDARRNLPAHSTRVHYITVQCSGWCNETSSGKIPYLRLDGKFSVYPDSAASRRRHAADQVGDKSGCFARDEEERRGGEKEEGGRGNHD